MTAPVPETGVGREQPLSAASTIKDQRPRPRGAIPRGAQVWFMLGLATVLLAIITLTGSSSPKDRRRSDGPVPVLGALDPERVAAYQAQLRERQEELARATQQAPMPMRTDSPGRAERGDSGEPRDPLADARRRKAYDSLFASSVAFARQTGASAERAADLPARANVVRPDDTLAVLDAQARESLRQLNESVTRLQGSSVREQSPRAAEPRDVSGSDVGARPAAQTAVSTPAIVPGGALHRLLEGTILDAEVRTPVDGEMAGQVTCQITEDVWSFNRDAVVIPKGSKVLGESKPVGSMGQRLLAMSFRRIIFPDGSTHALDQGAGLDQTGTTGVRANANTHMWSTFGAAAVVGLITGVTQAIGTGAVSGGDNRTVIIAGGGAEAMGQAAPQLLAPFTNRMPTLRVPAGRRIKIFLTRDLELPAYHDGRPDVPVWR